MPRIHAPAKKRGFLTVYYKNGQRIKTNSGAHINRITRFAREHLERGTYGADKVQIITRSNKNVRQTFVLKGGKAVAALEDKSAAPVVKEAVSFVSISHSQHVAMVHLHNQPIGAILRYKELGKKYGRGATLPHMYLSLSGLTFAEAITGSLEEVKAALRKKFASGVMRISDLTKNG